MTAAFRRRPVLQSLSVLLLAVYGWLAASLELHHNHGLGSPELPQLASSCCDGAPCPVRLFGHAP